MLVIFLMREIRRLLRCYDAAHRPTPAKDERRRPYSRPWLCHYVLRRAVYTYTPRYAYDARCRQRYAILTRARHEALCWLYSFTPE
jgi:hypothetical protein